MHSTEHQVFFRFSCISKLCLSLYNQLPCVGPQMAGTAGHYECLTVKRTKSLHSVYASLAEMVSVLGTGRVWKGVACEYTLRYML